MPAQTQLTVDPKDRDRERRLDEAEAALRTVEITLLDAQARIPKLIGDVQDAQRRMTAARTVLPEAA